MVLLAGGFYIDLLEHSTLDRPGMLPLRHQYQGYGTI